MSSSIKLSRIGHILILGDRNDACRALVLVLWASSPYSDAAHIAARIFTSTPLMLGSTLLQRLSRCITSLAFSLLTASPKNGGGN